MALFLHLPQETVDEFVDYVHDSDRQHLLTCTLIHRSFLPRCQFYLFSTIYLGGVGDTKRSRRINELYDILQRKPYLAQFIRELRLSVSGMNPYWLTYDRSFIQVMELLVEQGCVLHKFAIVKANPSWSAKIIDPAVFTKQIAPLVSSVRSLEFGELRGIPANLVTSCAELQSLILDGADFVHSQFEYTEHLLKNSLSTAANPLVRHLEISGSVDTLSNIVLLGDNPPNSCAQALDISRLRSFRVSISSWDAMGMASGVMNVTNRHLQTLSVLLDNPVFLAGFNLSESKALRVLELEIILDTHDTLNLLALLMMLIPHDNALEKIAVHVRNRYPTHWNRILMEDLNWHWMDQALSVLSKNRRLEFSFTLDFEDLRNAWKKVDVDAAVGEWERRAREKLPKTVSLPEISLSFV
ncbi:hypothetical protein GALMADRAFT_267630 [Galerina marginata CBS 339.88]|uniref:F-box domain-containing protein n=1 Tax=Galerina marginata (strain CBS 339.88) TaxID=685588 RepID=A0A067T0D7_GALM3|nr:hypothetical protein GALMADRAFT_267630 [Galerina marginata CBS 339.88]